MACSAGDTNDGFGGGDTKSNATGTGNGNGNGSESGPGTFAQGQTATNATGQGGSCAGTSVTAEKVQVDLFVMLDRSTSMETAAGAGTRWDVVTDALKQFVQQPQAAGLGVGLQYFGLPPTSMMCPATCTTDAECAGCGDLCIPFFGFCAGAVGGDSCNAADYTSAEVPIAALPGNAQAMIASIDAHSPSTGTPTLPALQGALEFSKQFQIANPTHVVVTVLATDGLPEACDNNISNVANAAAAGLAGMPSIRTFVVGVGDQLSNLNAIAQAGGSGMAYLVDGNANATQEFLDALNAIQGTVLACSYNIPVPTMGTINFDEVSVTYTPGGSSVPETFTQVANQGACPPGGNAWYYDNAAAPTQVLLCPDTCDRVSMDLNGKIDLALGCSTAIF